MSSGTAQKQTSIFVLALSFFDTQVTPAVLSSQGKPSLSALVFIAKMMRLPLKNFFKGSSK